MRNFFLGFVSVWFCSCQSDSSEIGADFFKAGALDIAYIDSATIKLSTVKFDSLITSDTEKIILGSYVDPKLGTITAASFLQPGVTQTVNLDDVNTVLDYVAVVLKYNGYFYYDTTTALTLNVHRVTQEIEANDDGYLYNTSHFAYDAEPWGTVSFPPTPNRPDSIEIRLPASFAQELFSKAQEGHTDLQNNTNFLKYLRGIAIIPDADVSTGLIGFSMPEMRMYYIDKSVVPSVQRYISFPVFNNSISNLYNSAITVDRPVAFEALSSAEDRLASAVTDDEAYLQAGAGLGLRVDMPYLRSLNLNTNFFITQAILEIYPIRNSYNKFKPLAGQLDVYVANRNNVLYDQPASTAILYADSDLNRDTRYSLDVTDFVKGQMELEELNENGLLFLMNDADFRSGTDRIYFAAPGYGQEYKTRLRIYYATINN